MIRFVVLLLVVVVLVVVVSLLEVEAQIIARLMHVHGNEELEHLCIKIELGTPIDKVCLGSTVAPLAAAPSSRRPRPRPRLQPRRARL